MVQISVAITQVGYAMYHMTGIRKLGNLFNFLI